MSELEGLIKQIEELRASMVKIKEGKSFKDPEIMIETQMLNDVFLGKYQQMLVSKHCSLDDSPNRFIELSNI